MPPISHEERTTGGAFFITRDGARIAELTYRRLEPELVVIDHTQVDASLRGQGVARALLDAAVAWARATHTRVRATCSYVRGQFEKDTTIQDVLA